MKIKKGDLVKVISGKEKGKEGKVESVLLEKDLVLIKGVNVVKRHVKPGRVSKEGGIISIERPIVSSRVMVVCEKCKEPTRISYKLVDGAKYRICKRCGNSL
ncbi:MAG: 50S ribosomal protein L24 [Patescibacteria group bacterium]